MRRRTTPTDEPERRQTSSANQQGRSSRTNQKGRRWRLSLVAKLSGATLASDNTGRGTRQRRGTQPRGSVRSIRALGFASDRGFLIRQGRKASAIPSTIRRGLRPCARPRARQARRAPRQLQAQHMESKSTGRQAEFEGEVELARETVCGLAAPLAAIRALSVSLRENAARSCRRGR